MPDADWKPNPAQPSMPPPHGRYQIRYQGRDVHGAHFESLNAALRFASPYPDHIVIGRETGQEERRGG